MIDGSWTHNVLFSGFEWKWTNSRVETQLWFKEPTAKNLTTSLGARGPLIGNEVHATAIDVSIF